MSRHAGNIGGRGYHRALKATLACAALFLAAPASARAERVLVLDGARVHVENQPGPGLPFPPAPAGRGRATAARTERTVVSELRRLRRAGAITRSTATLSRRRWVAALGTLRRLRGRRRLELGAVVADVREIAARRLLTASRVPLVFLTVARNREWWSRGPLLSYGERVGFAGSGLVWEAFPGQGIQLHPLGTWGKANALWVSDYDRELAALVREMRGVAVRRAGGIAWEYMFHFGGSPVVWTSGLSQATGAQALARAAVRFHDPRLAADAKRALGVFTHAPPAGVRVAMGRGRAHYLLYSWAPSMRVINGFVQAVVGLYDVWKLTGSRVAHRLYLEGEREARREVPRYDTGAWSRYDQYTESDLSYHVLLRDFLRNLCERSGRAVYCDTAERFTRYLHEPPRIRGITRWARARARGFLRFWVSKRSSVVVSVRRGSRVVWLGRSPASTGAHAWPWRAPSRPGRYTVTVLATDLAGNAGRATVRLRVAR